MRRIILIVFLIIPIFLLVPQAFGGTEINISSATVNSDTLTLKGINFDANGSELIVIINGTILNGCNVTSSEVTCDISGHTLDPGTTYTVSVSAGNAPAKNDEIDIYNPEGSSGSCPPGGFTSCYSGQTGTLGIGECKSGTTTCGNNGEWGPCEGEVTPVAEICEDGLDNDCDGVIGNGCGECVVDAECSGGSPPICTTPSSCQGSRTEARCVNYSCEVVTVPDDSACGSNIGITCGLYPDAFCSGGPDQSPIPCSTSCTSDEGCAAVAYCNGSICVPKRINGSDCSAHNECQSGFCLIVIGDVGSCVEIPQ